mmetsp:Transcript_7186/g.21915  ORF Transcript_7186/g.21915 Transcript_7186/m.21915 type:complete len:217 (-) Transcript_7186:582-1232(-)
MTRRDPRPSKCGRWLVTTAAGVRNKLLGRLLDRADKTTTLRIPRWGKPKRGETKRSAPPVSAERRWMDGRDRLVQAPRRLDILLMTLSLIAWSSKESAASYCSLRILSFSFVLAWLPSLVKTATTCRRPRVMGTPSCMSSGGKMTAHPWRGRTTKGSGVALRMRKVFPAASGFSGKNRVPPLSYSSASSSTMSRVCRCALLVPSRCFSRPACWVAS